MKPNYFYLVEYSRTGTGAWHLELRTLEEHEAIECYERNLREFEKFVWRITLVKEMRRSK